MSWFEFLNLSGIFNYDTKSLTQSIPMFLSFVFLLVTPCLLIHLIICQKGHECLSQKWAIHEEDERWNRWFWEPRKNINSHLQSNGSITWSNFSRFQAYRVKLCAAASIINLIWWWWRWHICSLLSGEKHGQQGLCRKPSQVLNSSQRNLACCKCWLEN